MVLWFASQLGSFRHSEARAVQLALRRRKAGISRTSSSVELCIGGDRPYASSPCGAALGEYSEAGVADRPSGWRVVGRSCGRSNCDSGALRSVRPAIRRLSLRSCRQVL